MDGKMTQGLGKKPDLPTMFSQFNLTKNVIKPNSNKDSDFFK